MLLNGQGYALNEYNRKENLGPDLQKILRLSYDNIYLKTLLSHTYDTT